MSDEKIKYIAKLIWLGGFIWMVFGAYKMLLDANINKTFFFFASFLVGNYFQFLLRLLFSTNDED